MSALLSGLRDRSLDPYPANARRIWYLALTVIATITLYYQLYMLASVAPLVQADFHLSLSHYVYSLILANILGALAALMGSFADRIGRGNLIVYGLLATGVCTLAIQPYRAAHERGTDDRVAGLDGHLPLHRLCPLDGSLHRDR